MPRTERVEMVQLTSRATVIFIWLYFTMNAVLAIWKLDGVDNPWPTLGALAVFGIVCAAISWDRGDRLSLPVTLLTVVAGPVNVALVSWHVVGDGYTTWYIGTGTVALFFMCLRGRILAAWLGFAALAAVVAIWGATTELGHAVALSIIARQLPVLIVGTLGAIGLERTGNDIIRVTAEASARAGVEAASRAATAEREARIAELEHSVSPLLAKIAEGQPLTPTDRHECALAEAELRDVLRARTLCVPDVVEATRAARRRGVEVILLDDSDPAMLSATDLQKLAAVLVAMLSAATDGRLTARLLPPGRENIGTIVADGSRYARHDVPRN